MQICRSNHIAICLDQCVVRKIRNWLYPLTFTSTVVVAVLLHPSQVAVMVCVPEASGALKLNTTAPVPSVSCDQHSPSESQASSAMPPLGRALSPWSCPPLVSSTLRARWTVTGFLGGS